jgi:hypothetical protein
MNSFLSGSAGSLPQLGAVADIVDSTTVDGIPTIFAHRDGPISAGLFFRVGRADETLATAGATHLVEHLALFRQTVGDLHHNGETADYYTHFHVTGTEAQVVTFLNQACASLRDLPVDRIPAEVEILRIEASRRQIGHWQIQRSERFGAVGMGQVAYQEFGLNVLSPDQVSEWARTRFTSSNAVLWITTSHLPAGLDLRLPTGNPHPILFSSETLKTTPAYALGNDGGVLIDAIVARSSAAAMFASVASRAMYRELRQEGGYSYTAHCEYEPIDATRSHIGLFADTLSEQQTAVVGGMVDLLAAMRSGRFEPTDLEHARESIGQMAGVPFLGAAVLPNIALNLLLEAPIEHPLALIKKQKETSVAELAAVADEVWRGALAQIPEGDLEWAGFAASPRWSDSTVEGVRYPYKSEPQSAVVIADNGVSFVNSQGASTVYFDETAAYLKTPDGARSFLGDDGFRVSLEPTLLRRLTPDVISRLDAAVPAHLHIPLAPRDPNRIPQPEINKYYTKGRKGFGGWAIVLAFLSYIFLPISFSVARKLSEQAQLGPEDNYGIVTTQETVNSWWIVFTVVGIAAVVFTVGAVRRVRWERANM